MANPKEPNETEISLGTLVSPEPSKQEKQIEELQRRLAHERDARNEDRFVGIVCLVILLGSGPINLH